MLLQLSHSFFSSLSPSAWYPHSLQHPPLSSCTWVIHISSLAAPFPILFLTFPCLFCAYKLCFLFPIPFPLILPPLPPSFPHFSSCPWVSHTCKCFGLSISHIILSLPMSILYLPFMLLIPCTLSPISLSPSPLVTLHVISISVILFLIYLFA